MTAKMQLEIVIDDEEEVMPLSETIKPSRKRKAMSSAKASKVKKDGHTNEDDFTQLLSGSFVKSGTGKTDVQYKDWGFSLKKECKRIQFALYSKNSKNWIETSPSAMLCKDCLTIYPDDFETYNSNKNHYKQLLREKMITLKNHLSIKDNLREYLNLIMFKNGEVDFLVMKDANVQYIYYASEVLDVLLNNVVVLNSGAIKSGDVAEQKVIIKCENDKKKLNNLLEIEVRNSGGTHYAEMLCVCNRDNLFGLLNRIIEETNAVNQNVVLKGNAIILLEQEFMSNSAI
jgi:hypothetical protein